MYEDEARKLTDKTPVQIVTVIEGTSRVVLQARFRGVRDFGFGFPLYECELMDESAEAMGGIAAGMSGSPVGPPGRIMGALAYGDIFAAAPTRFWVTSIDAMEAAIDHQMLGELGEEDGDDGDGEMPEDGEEDGEGDGDGEIPGDLPFPEGFPPLDGFPFPEDIGPPPTVEAELTIDGFIVTGSRDTTVTIKGEDMGDDMMPAEPEQPMEPAEPVEEE